MSESIKVLKGDLTTLQVDAIVNAANTSLLGGGGVDGAIHDAAGPELYEECKALGGCPVGEARITKGYNLPAKFIIHTVGPVWREGEHDEPELLKSAYENCLVLAKDNGIKTIAFPNISTGIYRFPKSRAARIAIETVKTFLKNNSIPQEIIFVCFDEENYALYNQFLE
ncbi:MAG: O-acetyl-ADP-ribose deacetylase [Bacteroidales bacterium]